MWYQLYKRVSSPFDDNKNDIWLSFDNASAYRVLTPSPCFAYHARIHARAHVFKFFARKGA